MATDADDALEIEQPETPEIEEIEQQPEAPEAEAEGEEIVFGDEPAPAAEGESAVIRHLREELKKARQQAAAAPKPAEIEVGPKPTLESCEYDGEKFERELDEWKDREAQAKQQQAKAGETDQQYQQQWQRDHQSYQAKRATAQTRFADYEEAESIALAVLDPAQQVTIVQVADDPALLLLALGKHPAKLAEIAAEKNPLKLAKAITQLEGKMTVKPRTKAPPPEEITSGTASMRAAAGDKALEKLRAEAEKSGDYSKVTAYKSAQKKAAK